MNIGNVKQNGSVDRGADRGPRVDGKRAPAGARSSSDGAAISSNGREAAAAFEHTVAAARAEVDERDDRVARAMQKLLGGELDAPVAVDATAARLIARGFRTI